MRGIALALAAAALVAGCVSPGKEGAVVTYRTAAPEELLALYNSNAAKITTLSAELQMVLNYRADHSIRQYRVSAWLDAQKPGKLRLRHDSLGSDLFFIVSDGKRYWIGLDQALAGGKDTVYTGAFGAPAQESCFRPDRLLSAFSLLPLPPAGTTETLFEAYPDRYVLVFVEGDATKRIAAKVFFSRVDLHLSSYQIFDEASRLVLQVDYKSYKTAAGADVPHELFMSWPLDHFGVLATVSHVKIGAELPARLWTFKWRDGAEVIDVDAAGSPQSPQPPSAESQRTQSTP